MYCAKCDRTEWDQIALEMGNCSRCYEPLFASEDDHEYYESQAKASEDNATHPAPRRALSGPGDASRLSAGSGTGAPLSEVKQVAITELIGDAVEILTCLYESIAKHGNYSAGSTLCFVDQAAGCLRDALTVCKTPEKPNETLLDAAFANCKPGEGFDGPQGAE